MLAGRVEAGRVALQELPVGGGAGHAQAGQQLQQLPRPSHPPAAASSTRHPWLPLSEHRPHF
jgi:hypothetical protein